MSEQRYTAQELREHADYMREFHIDKRAIEMLRQAADAEEELVMLKGDNIGLKKTNALLSVANNRLRDENAKLKARLEAVVKEFTQFKKDIDDRLTEAYVFASEITAKSSFDKIYGGVRDAVNGIRKELEIDSAARGEGGAE